MAASDPLQPLVREQRSSTQHLKRVFAIDIETCPECGGKLRVIAVIEEPLLNTKILAHVRRRQALFDSTPRASPDALSLPDFS